MEKKLPKQQAKQQASRTTPKQTVRTTSPGCKAKRNSGRKGSTALFEQIKGQTSIKSFLELKIKAKFDGNFPNSNDITNKSAADFTNLSVGNKTTEAENSVGQLATQLQNKRDNICDMKGHC